MSSLYKLSTELATIHRELMDADGELTPEREAALDRLKQALPQKEEGYVRWFLNVKAEEAAFDMEVERLTRKRDARRKCLEWIKAMFKWHLEQHGLKRIETPLGVIRLQDNSQAKLEHTLPLRAELGELPEDIAMEVYDLIPEHFELNEKRLRDTLGKNIEIAGATLTKGQHIRIG